MPGGAFHIPASAIYSVTLMDIPSDGEQAAHRRKEMLAKLNDQRLTGMTRDGLACLCAALAPLQAARAQQRYSQQRGGRARRATGNVRGRPLFDNAARLLLTLLYQRQVCSMNVLADLLEVTATCVGDLVKETREILEDHGHDPGVAPVRFTSHDALLAFADSDLRPHGPRSSSGCPTRR